MIKLTPHLLSGLCKCLMKTTVFRLYFFQFVTIKLGWFIILCFEAHHKLEFPNCIVFLYLNIFFLTNSADSDIKGAA